MRRGKKEEEEEEKEEGKWERIGEDNQKRERGQLRTTEEGGKTKSTEEGGKTGNTELGKSPPPPHPINPRHPPKKMPRTRASPENQQ